MKIAIHNHALRVHDNELLTLPEDVRHVYVNKTVGGAKAWWLARSVAAHSERLARMGIRLEIVDTLPDAEQYHVNQHPSLARDERYVVYDNGYLLTGGTARHSLSAFVKSSRKGDRAIYVPNVNGPPLPVQNEPMPEVDWPVPTEFDMWVPGEFGAMDRLAKWHQRVSKAEYGSFRGYPSTDVTSRLSPHLSEGEITPRQIAAHVGEDHPIILELHWREYKHHIARVLDYTTEVAPRFRNWRWTNDLADIEAWRYGYTGCPLVDAGMRELWFTGFMDNRVRMIVASYLVQLLNVDWRIGAAWFMDTLVDADEAINNTQWQAALGSVVGYQPFTVIMNPYTQQKKFDAADYIARWPVSPRPLRKYQTPVYETARAASLLRHSIK